MKEKYSSIEEFKKDLNKEYTFRDICEINSWIDSKEFKEQMICCKFHKEKTPSMQIGDHFFRCYGCGERGDIFTFAQKINNYSFIEALNDIAESVKTIVDTGDGYNNEEIKRKRILMTNMWNQYIKDFEVEIKTNKALQAEAKRYFPFDVGYNRENNRLVLAFKKNDRPLGFTMRRLNENINPKWLHSGIEDSLTATISQIFNIDSLKNSESAYVVEGPGDVASMVRAGYDNTICCCGTSNISDKTLARITAERVHRLNFLTDGDNAGVKARKIWCKELIKYDYFIAAYSNVIIMTDGKDPGSCTVDELREIIENNKIRVIDYFINNSTDDEIKEICNDKSFFNNPIRRQLITKFSYNINVTEEEAEIIIKSKKTIETEEDEETKEYINRLKSTAGYEDFGLRYPKFEDITPEKAKRILKLKFGIK